MTITLEKIRKISLSTIMINNIFGMNSFKITTKTSELSSINNEENKANNKSTLIKTEELNGSIQQNCTENTIIIEKCKMEEIISNILGSSIINLFPGKINDIISYISDKLDKEFFIDKNLLYVHKILQNYPILKQTHSDLGCIFNCRNGRFYEQVDIAKIKNNSSKLSKYGDGVLENYIKIYNFLDDLRVSNPPINDMQAGKILESEKKQLFNYQSNLKQKIEDIINDNKLSNIEKCEIIKTIKYFSKIEITKTTSFRYDEILKMKDIISTSNNLITMLLLTNNFKGFQTDPYNIIEIIKSVNKLNEVIYEKIKNNEYGKCIFQDIERIIKLCKNEKITDDEKIKKSINESIFKIQYFNEKKNIENLKKIIQQICNIKKKKMIVK